MGGGWIYTQFVINNQPTSSTTIWTIYHDRYGHSAHFGDDRPVCAATWNDFSVCRDSAACLGFVVSIWTYFANNSDADCSAGDTTIVSFSTGFWNDFSNDAPEIFSPFHHYCHSAAILYPSCDVHHRCFDPMHRYGCSLVCRIGAAALVVCGN